ncbi:HSP20 family molecular chaperone IbpA [Evansella vedderi]|uniref:HSP20 family molecular chaperone IbpA n=1 Tax=Evansella vedderi TaxID=38282 RepID=A0ABT9ZT52_9BACI|nr:Hsp20/alpha crystallin family protein [Evansella vedderi]MDQ0253901.1 HSP20 family molecular chaperone IbpA [Evansella vedderi]
MSQEKKNSLQPFREGPFGEILQSLDSLFQDTFRQLSAARFIPINQYETQSEYVIEAEIPGIKKEQISLDVYHNYIKISVQSEEILEQKDDKNQLIKHNSRYERAERVVALPFGVNESEVNAELRDGILTIRIPNKRKRIQIK